MTSDDRVRRRLAAVLALDVVGFSRQMEVDEADTLERLFALRTRFLEPRISHHEGRIANTSGDGVLVEFRSVADAVDCAISIQSQLPDWPNFGEPLELRIGIHLGEVVVRDGDLFGDCVNIAARLEQSADSGGILLSDTAREQLTGDAAGAFEDTGEAALKNLSRAIRTWRWHDNLYGAAESDDERPSGAKYDNVSVIFVDVAGFTEWGDAASATELVTYLDRVFRTLDHVGARHGVKKIQVFGDAYLGVAGLPDERDDHAACAARFAIAARDELAGLTAPTGKPVKVTIGMHCGPVIAGVVGPDKRPYGLWSETVNMAAHMERQRLAQGICISDTFRNAMGPGFDCVGPLETEIRGTTHVIWGLNSVASEP